MVRTQDKVLLVLKDAKVMLVLLVLTVKREIKVYLVLLPIKVLKVFKVLRVLLVILVIKVVKDAKVEMVLMYHKVQPDLVLKDSQGKQGEQGKQGKDGTATNQGIQGITGVGAQGAAGTGSALTVQQLAGKNGNVDLSVTSVSTLQFDNNSGFNVTNQGNGTVFVDLGSTFNPWQLVSTGTGYVAPVSTLSASGEEAIQFVAGNGMQIISDANSTPKKIRFVSTACWYSG